MTKSLSSKLHTMPSTFSLYSPKLSIFILVTFVVLFLLFQIKSLGGQTPLLSSSSLIHQWQNLIINTTTTSTCYPEQLDKLRRAVTFLPLKDYRFANEPQKGHTWFMSSIYDKQQQGEVQYQRFPSESSDGRVLCLKGRHLHDGAWNSYALAWPETLPQNATFLKGLTFVSNNHYNYANIWHGLAAVLPFVAWHQRNGCAVPERWVLYHWGELRLGMGPWLSNIVEATFGAPPRVEGFDGGGVDIENAPVCFEEAVVTRHDQAGMSRERMMEAYDLIRCKARDYCNVSRPEGSPEIQLTMFMRTGARSFRNETAVVEVFGRECAKVDGCKLAVAYSNNLTFCEQVKVMSMTDILVSPHGAQLTNMFLMDRNSSVMEFFPKGWLKVAGVGQFVYHWIASWSGMRHRGAWRDTEGVDCPYPDDDLRCMSVFKDGLIGYNETFFSEWATNVLNEVKAKKMNEALNKSKSSSIFNISSS